MPSSLTVRRVVPFVLLALSLLIFSSKLQDEGKWLRIFVSLVCFASILLFYLKEGIRFSWIAVLLISFWLIKFGVAICEGWLAEGLIEFTSWSVLVLAFLGGRYFLKIENHSKLRVALSAVFSVVILVSIYQLIEQAFFTSTGFYSTTEITGWYGNRNLNAQMLAFAGSFFISVIVSDHKGKIDWKYLLGFVLSFFLIILTQARTVWLYTILSGLLLLPVLLRRFASLRLRIGVMTGLFVLPLVAYPLMPSDSFQRLLSVFTDKGSGLGLRKALWSKSFEMIEEFPLLGVGSGQWKFQMSKFGENDVFGMFGRDIYVHTHNEFLQSASESGLIVGTLLLFLVLGALFAALRNYSLLFQSWQGIFFSLILLSALVFNTFSFSFQRPWFLVLYALSLTYIDQYVPHIFSINNRRVRIVILFGVLGLLGVSWKMIQLEAHSKSFFTAYNKQHFPNLQREFVALGESEMPYDHVATPYAFYIGTAKLNGGDAKAALSNFDDALRIHPYHPQVLHGRTISLVKLGKYQEAHDNSKELLTLFPQMEEERFFDAFALLQLKRNEEALSQMRLIQNPTDQMIIFQEQLQAELTNRPIVP